VVNLPRRGKASPQGTDEGLPLLVGGKLNPSSVNLSVDSFPPTGEAKVIRNIFTPRGSQEQVKKIALRIFGEFFIYIQLLFCFGEYF